MVAIPLDVAGLRDSYTSLLAKQRGNALKGVSDIYAQRGTTGSGEEGYALGQTGEAYGQGVASMEQNLAQLQMQQQNQGFQQDLATRGMANQESQFGQQFGLAQQGQNFNQGMANQQFGLAQQGQNFNQGMANQEFGLAQQGQNFGQDLANRNFGLAQQGQEFGQGLANRQFGLEQSGQDLQGRLAEAGLTGLYRDGLNGKPVDTIAGQEFGQKRNESLRMDAIAKLLDYPNAEAMQLGLASGGDIANRLRGKPAPTLDPGVRYGYGGRRIN